MKAQVLLPKIFNFSFTYNSNNIPLKLGDLVEVPFGKNKEVGVIWKNINTELKNIKIKNISKKIKDYSIDQNLIDFIEWFAAYNMVPLGLALKMAIGNNNNFIKKIDPNFYQTKRKQKSTSLIMNKKKHLNT